MLFQGRTPSQLILSDTLEAGLWIADGNPVITPSNEVTTLDTATFEAVKYAPGLTAASAIQEWTLGTELTAFHLPNFYLTSVSIKRIVKDAACGVDTLIVVSLTALGMVQPKPIRTSYAKGIMQTDAYTFYERADTLSYKIEGIILDGASLPELTPTKLPSQYPTEFMTGQLRDQDQVRWDPMPQCYPQRPSGWVMTSEDTRKIDYTPWTLASRGYEYTYPFTVQ